MTKMRRMPRCLPALLAASAVLLLMLPSLLAQATGSISGKITDATGAVIPGAEVTVTHLGTGAERTAVSSDEGLFRVTNLNPGRYTVKAALTGFKTSVSEPLELTVGQVAHVELQLQVGDIQDEVVVTGAAATIEVEQGRVSTLVDEKKVVNLPLNGRNVMQLVRLAPGAINASSTISEPGADNAVANAGSDFDGSGGQTSVNGGRVNMNGFWIDGVSAKQLSGGTTSTPSVDAVQEFRLETLNFSAEYGASVGSVVSVITKSGSNDFHGSVYEFHRNDNADAREFFDNNKPEFKQNQFGFTVGGPIVKDQTFFFFSYEGTRIRTGNTALTTYESGAWRDFVLANGQPVAKFLYSNFGGPPLESNIQTVGQYLSAQGYTVDDSQAEVDAFLATTFGSAPGALSAAAPMVGDVAFFTPNATDGDQISLRVDQELGDSDKVYGRYLIDDQDGLVVDPRPAFNSPAKIRTHNGVLNWTRIISPNMVNEARFGFNRAINDVLAGNAGVPRLSDTGTGTAVFGAYNGYPQIFHENTFTWADTLSLTKGRHGMKMGVEVRRDQENSEFNVGRPSYYFFDLVSLGLDDPYYQIGGVDPGPQGAGQAQLASNFRAWRGTELSFFFNDDYKLRPNLTLNLGIRWDWFGRLTEDQDRATRYNLEQGDNIFQRVALGGFEAADKLSSDDYNNFAPRIGLAWDPFGDGKMSIRAGYGVAYNGAIYNPLANSRWNPPYYSFNLICRFDVCGRPNENILLGPQNGDPITSTGVDTNPGGALFEGNIIAYDPTNNNTNFLSGIPNPNMRDPYVQSFFLGVQREIARGMAFEVNYVGTMGTKLIRAENFNRFNGDFLGAPSPADGQFAGDESLNRVNPAFGVLRFWENSVNSNYHSLQVQLDRRYSNGFAFNANYTLSKSLDTRSTWHSGATSSNRGQEGYSTDISAVFLDYGRSIFDARHRFTANFIYETPFFHNSTGLAKQVLGGWEVNGVISLQSGQPFTPHDARSFGGGGDYNADGTGIDRTDTPSIGNTLSNVSRSDYANGLFNGVVFPAPPQGTTGDLGRNTFNGPGFANVDFSLFKDISLAGTLSEESKIQFRVEFFNLFNRVNFLQPEPRLNFSQFGRSTDTFDAREIQFGLKFIF